MSEVNRLLGAVVDVENIFMSMHREDDHDTKRVYYYLFKVSEILFCFGFIVRLLIGDFFHLGKPFSSAYIYQTLKFKKNLLDT